MKPPSQRSASAGLAFVTAKDGTPGFLAASVDEAYFALGVLHGRYRPLQCQLLATAARGALAATLLPRADLVAIDRIVHRWDLPGIAEREVKRLDVDAKDRLDAYLAGVHDGLDDAFLKVPLPDRASVIGGFLLSSYLGLAQGQERMEHAIVEAVNAGANPDLLERMFAPHLQGWNAGLLLGLVQAAGDTGFFSRKGGSNAWAVSPERSRSGAAILCGDPHLQLAELPSVFFEIAARVADDYWLGATIPGLPGLAVGRNKHVGWSGTFSCADNVDFSIETLDHGRTHVMGRHGPEPLIAREVEIGRRFRRPLRLRFYDCPRGVIDTVSTGERTLSCQWYARESPAQALSAYLRLPEARSAAEAERILDHALTLSLHFVLADRSGDVRYRQVGSLPSARSAALFPVPAQALERGPLFLGEALPRARALDGFVASANEARQAGDGRVLSTLAQPSYRLERISALLRAQKDHDVSSMQAIQLDVFSLQAERLRHRFAPYMHALAAWDLCCDADSIGATAFAHCYRAARGALAHDLGGAWFLHMLDQSELGVWWCAAIDRLLLDPRTWQGALGLALDSALQSVARKPLRPWGEEQRVRFAHVIFGGVPGAGRGPFPLPGSIATVRQGNLVPAGKSRMAIGPAYRFITDMASDEAFTSLPGGIDGAPLSSTYTAWLDDWQAGRYHRLCPPEQPCPPEQALVP